MSRLPGLDWRKSWSSQGPVTKELSKSILFLLSVSSGGRTAPVCCAGSLFSIVREITPQLYAKTYKKNPGFSLLYLGEGRAIIYPLSGFRVAWRLTVGLCGTSGNHLFIGDYSFHQPRPCDEISVRLLIIYFIHTSQTGIYFIVIMEEYETFLCYGCFNNSIYFGFVARGNW